MEDKFKKRQIFIISMLALSGIVFIWISEDVKNSKFILLLGVLLCLAAVLNLVFYGKIIQKNISAYESNKEEYQNIENTLKSINRLYSLKLVWLSIIILLIFVLILFSKLNIIIL